MRKRKIVTRELLRRERVGDNQSFASKCVKNLRAKATPYEKRFYTMMRVKYPSIIFQKSFIINEKVYIVDFYLPQRAIAIELDGCQHYEDKHSMRDALRDEALDSIGVRVIRLKNREIDYVDIDLLLTQKR